jgi:2-phosphoglycerate kinase
LDKDRNWTVLLVGGASGTGKSSCSYGLGRFYNINVIEIDDLHQAMKSVTTKETLPLIHFWSTGIDWIDIGVNGNVDWLIGVSKEMIPALKAVVQRHLDDKLPVIIEGDFLHPEFLASFNNPMVKAIFLQESDKAGGIPVMCT